MLLENFKTQSSLPRDDGIVVEGVDESQALLPALVDSFVVGFVIVGAVQYDLGSIRASGGHFGERGGERHDDVGCDLMAAGMVGDALRMIARGRCDYAARALIGIESEEFVQRAALFEGSGALLVIEFQENRIIGESGKCF